MKDRIKSVELWRLLFALSIVLNHSRHLPWWHSGRDLLCTSLGVEFFFVLSGYLMTASVRRMPRTCSSVGEETWRFLWRKAKAIYPFFVFAVAFDLLCAYVLRNGVLSESSYCAYFWDFFFLSCTGLGNGGSTIIGGAWYISAMLLGMALMFPLLRKYTDTFLHIIAPLLTVFLCGWFAVRYGNMGDSLVFTNGGVCLGLLRGIACMSAGCLCFLIQENISRCKRRTTDLIWTAMEFLALGGVFWIAVHYPRGAYDFISVFLIMIVLTAAFSGKSLLSKWLSKLNVSWSGEYSLALYLNHFAWVRVLREWNLPVPWKWQALLLVLLSLLTALVCFFFLRLLRQLIEKWKGYRADMTAQS